MPWALLWAALLASPCANPRGIAKRLATVNCRDANCTRTVPDLQFFDQTSGIAVDGASRTLFLAQQQGEFPLVHVQLGSGRAYPAVDPDRYQALLLSPYALAFVAAMPDTDRPALFVTNYLPTYSVDGNPPLLRVDFSAPGNFTGGAVSAVVTSGAELYRKASGVAASSCGTIAFVTCGVARAGVFPVEYALLRVDLTTGTTVAVAIRRSSAKTGLGLSLQGLAIERSVTNTTGESRDTIFAANYGYSSQQLLKVIVPRYLHPGGVISAAPSAFALRAGGDSSGGDNRANLDAVVGVAFSGSLQPRGQWRGDRTVAFAAAMSDDDAAPLIDDDDDGPGQRAGEVMWLLSMSSRAGVISRLAPVGKNSSAVSAYTCPSSEAAAGGWDSSNGLALLEEEDGAITLFVAQLRGSVVSITPVCGCPDEPSDGGDQPAWLVPGACVLGSALLLGLLARGRAWQRRGQDTRLRSSWDKKLEAPLVAGRRPLLEQASKAAQLWSILPDELLVDFGDVLGSGATSRVFRGEFLGAAVAVKELALAFPRGGEEVGEGGAGGGAVGDTAKRRCLQGLERECALLSALHHPNIVKFFGVCYVSATPTSALVHIVIELCPLDLERAMCHGGQRHGAVAGHLRPRDWLAFARQIVAALSFIHARGIIHRDLKPAHVLVQESGCGGGSAAMACCKLCDFGISKETAGGGALGGGGGDGGRAVSHTGMQGTPTYMAPEVVVQSRAAYTSKVDVYSLGVLLWAMWTGALPYEDVPGSVYQMLKAIEGGARPARAPVADVPQVPDALWQLLQVCWATAPGRRPTMAQVADRLAEGSLLEALGGGERQVSQPQTGTRLSDRPAVTRLSDQAVGEGEAAALDDDVMGGDEEHALRSSSLPPAPPSPRSSRGSSTE